MNKKDFLAIAATLEEYYCKQPITKSGSSIKLWYELLGDIDYGVCRNAAMQLMATSKFFPTAAEIRQVATESFTMNVMDVDEAWGTVIRAIRTYGYMGESEALDSFPEPCKSVVRNIGWQNLCQSENIMAERAFFRDNYKVKMERQKKENVLPLSVRNEKTALLEKKISQAAGALTMKEPPNG